MSMGTVISSVASCLVGLERNKQADVSWNMVVDIANSDSPPIEDPQRDQ